MNQSLTTIVFIDGSLTDLQTILSGLDPSVTAIVLDPAQDGIQQMADALAGMSGLDAIHIISHGASGQINLGTTQLSQDTLAHYRDQLTTIGNALADTGDLLLYGCNVAQGDVGQAFISALASATGADVAASTDLTGAAFLDGDWVLEANTGSIEATSLNIGNDYQSILLDDYAGDSSTTGQLTTTAPSATGTIDFFGDADWWKVSLVHGYQYQVWIEGSTRSPGTLVDPYLAVYNGDGTFAFANNDASFLSYYSYATVIPSSTGYFFLSAEEYGNNGTGTYRITIWQDELASVSSAATVAVNSISSEGHIGWQGDVSDWYAVTLTAGIQYQFDLIGSATDGALSGLTLVDPSLTLRNSTGVQLLTDDDSGLGQNSRFFFIPSTSGTYFLDAQEYGNNAYGTYRLIVNATPTGGALTLGTTQTGSVDFAGNVDLYSVSLTAGMTYAFALDGGTLINPYLEVLNNSGTTQDYDDDSGSGLNAYLTFTPTTSGTYYLAARESGNNATGSYSARVWQLPTVSIADASVVEGDSGTTNLVFTLTLSAVSTIDVSVAAETSGTATATYSIDYIPRYTTVTFTAGQTSATYTVQVLGDLIFEPTESFHVLLSSPASVVLGDSDAYGYISDNDSPYSLPSDSFIGHQWYLYPTTGINAFPVWTDYTGAGVRVAVFDQGIDPNHPDLNDNLLTSLGRNASNLSVGGAPILSTDNHGTAVAGTIAAERNGSGIVGVAYGADLVSIYSPLAFNGMASQIANAYSYATNVDVLNDSWGFANGFATGTTWAFYDNFQETLFSAAGTALANLATTGRHGLGTVVVQSAGNSFSVGDDTNLHNFQNSQYIITVAATDYGGNVTSYSSPGASVLVAAPGGGGTDWVSEIITTDRIGTAGFHPTDYTFINGTSFSAPITSGVVALMLEANPYLGYRDVQEILAYSARETSSANNDWRYNGATNWNGGGLHYDADDHDLGYGLIDATAAVRLAETWGNSPHTAANRQQVSVTHSPALAIPDNSFSGAFDSISVIQNIEVERVEVTLKVTHPFVGDLSVLLTSPSGTTSFLLWRPQQNPLSAYGTGQNDIHFTFDTVLNWGESSVGGWSLFVLDLGPGDVGRLDSWTLNLIGKPASDDDTYIYTNEFSEATTAQAARSTLSDTGGIDTLNASAVSSSLALNLAPGGVSTIDGRSLTIAAGTVIENAYGGDVNDTLIGNSAANGLFGMRGNDSLDGGSGDDLLTGGSGNDSLIGGADTDTANFSGNRSQYTLTATLSGWTLAGPDGSDTLTGIEFATFSDQTISIGNFAPTGSVTISGTATQGQTLTAANTLADIDGLGTISYQWQADGSAITGATNNTYVLTQADVGKAISVVASYTDLRGTAEAVASGSVNVSATTSSTTTSRYTLLGTGANLMDFYIPYGNLALDGQNIVFKGNSGIDSVYVGSANGLIFDFTQAGLGVDQIYLSGNWADYSRSYSGSVVTLTRTTGGSETIKTISGDSLVFANGTVAVLSALNFLKGTAAEPIPAGATSTAFPMTVAGTLNNTVRAVVQDASGETIALNRPGVAMIVKGGSGVDVVYATAGASIDVTQLGLGQDKLYLTGKWTDYGGTYAGSVVTLTRTVGTDTETVKFLGGSVSAYDSIVFADGTANSIDILNYLKTTAGAPTLNTTEITPLGTGDIFSGTPGADTIVIADAGTTAASSATIIFTSTANGTDTVIGFSAAALTSGGDVLDFSAIANLADSVATGQTLTTDFAAGNVFIFNNTPVTIAEAANAIASDASVIATDGYIVLADSANGNAVTAYHSTDLAANGTETALVILSGVNIANLAMANFLV